MPDGFSRYDVIAEFRDAFRDAGLVVPVEIIADDRRWHRCDVIGKRRGNKAGQYRLFTDKWPGGALQNFVESSFTIWHPKSERSRKLSDEERAERKRFFDQVRAEAEADLAARQAGVAASDEWKWTGLVEDRATPYTSRKKVGTHGARTAPYGIDLYVPARDIDGKLWCLQHIAQDGSNLFRYGARVKGNFFAIGELVDGEPIQIAEGFATAASAFEANGVATVGAFHSGNLLPVAAALRERYPNSPITILADDDAATALKIGYNPGIKAATQAAIAVGAKIAIPDFGGDLALTDFNDLHVSAGLDAVRQQIAAARDPVERAYAAADRPLSMEEARAKLDEYLDGYMRAAVTWNRAFPRTENGYIDLSANPPCYCVAMPPGVGKTTAMIKRVARVGVDAGKNVLIAVPRHKLGKQIADDLSDERVHARVYQARGADDLEKPGTLMCPDKERVSAIGGALGDISKLACKSSKGVCELYEVCGYQRQQRPPKPEVWIVAHQMLFRSTPGFIPSPDIVIIDEGFHDASFEKDTVVELNDLVSNRGWPKDHSVADEADLRAISQRVYRRLIDKLADHPRGRMRREWFDGITAEDAHQAGKLEWKRKLIIDDVWPGQDAYEAIERSVARQEHNQLVKRLTAFWEKLARTLEHDAERSLWLKLERDYAIPDADRSAPAIVVMSRLPIADDIARCPILHLDAFLSLPVVECFFPRTEPRQLEIAMPPLTTVAIEQQIDRVIGKSAKSDLLIREACRLIEGEAARTTGRVGVITLKGHEAELRKRALPASVSLAHYGDVTGRNDLEDVSTLVLLGRPEPAPIDVEQKARLLFEREVAEVSGYYPRQTRGQAVRGSDRLVPADCSYHPDPGVEQLRWAACEGELMQALHRARPLNRAGSNSLRIVLATNVVLPIEVDFVTTWDDLQPTLFELMLARGGAVPNSHADQATAYPELFENENVARLAHRRERENPGRFLYWILNRDSTGVLPDRYYPIKPAGCYRELTGVFVVHYRRVGARGPATGLAFDQDRHPDPLAWLREHIGECVLVEQVRQ